MRGPKTKYLKTLSEEDISKKLLYILLITVSLYFIYFFAFSEIRKIIAVVPDDAPYYFKIAENVAHGKGLSFDGINKTNGFQPLWLYVLVPIYLVYSGSPDAMLRIFLLLQVVLLTVSAFITYSVLGEFFSRRAGLISGIGFIMIVFVPSINGMESALLIFMLSLLFVYGWKGKVFSRHSPKRELFFGIILGLVMLARLDTVFLGAAISAYCVIQIAREPIKRRDHLIRLIIIITGASLIVSPYLLFNYLEFSSIMPINGALKSSFPKNAFSYGKFTLFGKRYVILAIFAFFYFLWKLFTKTKKQDWDKNHYFETSMMILSFAIILHFLHFSFFMKWTVFGWHFMPYAIFGALTVSEISEYILSCNLIKNQKNIFWIGIISLIIAGTFIINERNNRPISNIWSVNSYNSAIWAQENSQYTDIFAMEDTGIFGYFSERTLINLDGVVNSFEYQDVLKNKQLNRYLKSNHVKYYVHYFYKEFDKVFFEDYDTFLKTIKSQKYNIESDELILKEENEVYRSSPFSLQNHEIVFLIWKLQIN